MPAVPVVVVTSIMTSLQVERFKLIVNTAAVPSFTLTSEILKEGNGSTIIVADPELADEQTPLCKTAL